MGLRRWQDGAAILLRYKVKICQLSRNSELSGSRGENKEKIRSGAGEGMTTGVRQELNGMYSKSQGGKEHGEFKASEPSKLRT